MKLSTLIEKYNDFSRCTLSVLIEGKEVYPSEFFILEEAEIELTLSSQINYINLAFTKIKKADLFFSNMLCGSKIVLKAGYHEKELKVFTGYIHMLKHHNEDKILKRVIIYAQDTMGLMKLSSHFKYAAQNTNIVISEMLNKTLYKTYIDKVVIGDISENMKKLKFIQKESDYEFMCYLAQLFHYDFYCDKDTLYFQKAYKNKQMNIEFDNYKYIDHINVISTVESQIGNYQISSYGKDYASISFSDKHSIARLALSEKTKKITSNTNQYYPVEQFIDSASLKQYGQAESEMKKHEFLKVEITMRLLPDIECGNIIRISINEHMKDQKVYIEKVTHEITKSNSFSIIEGSIIE